MPAHEGGAARTGAGVRKPPMEETAGGVARWRFRRCGDLAAVSASTTFAIMAICCAKKSALVLASVSLSQFKAHRVLKRDTIHDFELVHRHCFVPEIPMRRG